MHRYAFLILLLGYNVLCISDDCVIYNFEDNQKANFTNNYGICRGLSSWTVGQYSSLPIAPPHRTSYTFITPQRGLSCVSSFKFSITGSGVLEFNVYMAPASATDQITLLVFQSLPNANDATIGNVVLSQNVAGFVPGWNTMRVQITGFGTHEGFITLLGMASESSIVLVDSFRYVAPGYDIDSCKIYYPGDESTTTEKPPSTSTQPPTSPTTETLTSTTEPAITSSKTPTTIAEPAITSTETPTKITEPAITITKKPTTTAKPSTNSTTKYTTTTKSVYTSTAKPTTTTKYVISSTEKPTTVVISPTTERITSTLTTPSSTTTVAGSTSTERPRLSVSILLIKIRKFFR